MSWVSRFAMWTCWLWYVLAVLSGLLDWGLTAFVVCYVLFTKWFLLWLLADAYAWVKGVVESEDEPVGEIERGAV